LKIGYFDCYSGLSGDMILGAILDCGLSLDLLTADLAKLHLKGYSISAQPATRGVITGTQVTVALESSKQRRHLKDILELIEKSGLCQRVKQRSALIFNRLAEAESKVHRIPVDEVHFHEVGATDAIVDVVGSVIGFELLGIEALFSSPLPTGSGTVNTEHGIIPIPAPATLELIASSGASVRPSVSPDLGELVTPTGAAIVTTLASFDSPTFTLERIGYGVGTRDIAAIPNVLPLWIGERIQEERQLVLLETNIDDMSSELFGHVMDRLFAQGALDVWFTPIQMKKNRPAVMLSVLSPPEAEEQMLETILRETSTLGVRVQRMERHECEREMVPFNSSLGMVMVKVKRFQGKQIGLSLEFEDCRRIALENDLPLQEVYRIVTTEASAQLWGT
jgi:hypothetical protein